MWINGVVRILSDNPRAMEALLKNAGLEARKDPTNINVDDGNGGMFTTPLTHPFVNAGTNLEKTLQVLTDNGLSPEKAQNIRAAERNAGLVRI